MVPTAGPPDKARDLWTRARSFRNSGDTAAAASSYHRARRVVPHDVVLLREFGDFASTTGNWALAAELYADLAKLEPLSNAPVLLGVAFLRAGHPAKAIPPLEAHLERYPEDIAAREAVGFAYQLMERWENAIRTGKILETHAPSFRSRYMLLDGLYHLGRGKEMDLLVAESLEQYATLPHLTALCALHLLKRGDYSQGFRHAHALHQKYASARRLPAALSSVPTWNGRPFKGPLLVRSEQGLGDEIAFALMLRGLARLDQQVIADCDPRLLGLMKRSFPGIEFVSCHEPALERIAAEYPACQLTSALEIAQILAAKGCLPATDPWLRPDPELTARLRNTYRTRWPGRKVISASWRSHRFFPDGGTKSMPVSALAPLLQRADTVVLDLQHGPHEEDLLLLQRAMLPAMQCDDSINPLDDIDGLLAQLSATDGLLTVSNATAHLAGAAGVTTHLLLPESWPVMWYWGYEGSRTRWYPSVKIRRCSPELAWHDLVASAARELTDMKDREGA